MELVLASNNQGKRREIEALLEPLGIRVRSASELGFDQEVAETGATFEENARLKACTVAKALGLPALADDSGLVVKALNGEPGVYSARYAGEKATDQENNLKLLAALEGVVPAQREAAFVCVMVCCLPGGKTLNAKGRLKGRIALKQAGDGGFGYDPVFELPQRGLCLAQVSVEEKNAISHRAQALASLVKRLGDFLKQT
ncbi:MAG: XTP/dITP diphosphatase [Desulfarculaceae bacterium]